MWRTACFLVGQILEFNDFFDYCGALTNASTSGQYGFHEVSIEFLERTDTGNAQTWFILIILK